MIKYICNRCRKDIERKKDVILIQTKIGDVTTAVHLCPECHTRIKNLCLADVKGETSVIVKKETTEDNISKQSICEGKKSVIDVSSFNREMEKVPRSSAIPAFQRVLLALYKGMSCTQVADLVGKSYQEIYRIRSRYGCQEVASRNVAEERFSSDVVKVIDAFVTCGDIDEVVVRTKVDKTQVSNILSKYAGLEWCEESSIESNVEDDDRNFPINIESFPDSISKKPRATTLLMVMRIALCAYKGMGPTETGNVVGAVPQKCYMCKKDYTCKEVAQRHLRKERMDSDVVSIIDTFIKCGDIYKTYVGLGISEDKVREVLAYYTGLLKED